MKLLNLLTMRLILIFFLSNTIFCTSGENSKRDLSSIKTDVVEPLDCQKLGVVTGATIKDLNVTEAYKASLLDLKSLAYDQGANFVFIKRISQGSKYISGIAYKCKN